MKVTCVICEFIGYILLLLWSFNNDKLGIRVRCACVADLIPREIPFYEEVTTAIEIFKTSGAL